MLAKDATEKFNAVGHSANARKHLATLCIGHLA